MDAVNNRPVVLITGSARGIGLAAAEALAAEGFSIAVNGPVDDEELRMAVRRIEAYGVPVVAAPFDVTRIDAHRAALEAVEAKLGPLTTLVNNAGVGVLQRGDMLDVSEESWDRCMAVNSKAMFFLSQAFARQLLSRERPALFHSIVNITSSNAVAVAEQRAEYCASKAAASMVSKALAVRLGREEISVYDVQPGLIATEMTAPVIDSYRDRAAAGLTLLPRVGEPGEIGRLIASLASGRLPYTTGMTIPADAGMLVPRF
ncbi:NAD(P)-dependent dehydrogenase (short-subunit alcohol dehydrogenase family) [Ochrobactrum daejeonense]|uniref:NAD(P)-dependent dehydrogenase (Short-subunit alcohol dehydrogenase family) n=1 Tax=Brucella daejeonensis TaxID=659015 RepID=A0A7W9AWN5_9HYPH|nr:3-ketoacyl-ACP reductase [Brucella daejeonensis]MBB5701990.1 NAD(P)-dependent dehydrogenase (short-subunit alcohol dehydrogenase family) [Brucella daejeonensis]